jgi:hypothetical protein
VDHPIEPANPPHDRVRLTPSERARLADLERALDDDPASGGRARAGLRLLGRLAARFVRLSPWLVLAGVSLLPFAITGSRVAGLVCALFVTVALTTWLVTFRERRMRRLAERGARAEQPEQGRAGGHPGG